MSGYRISVELRDATVAQLRAALSRTDGRTGSVGQQSARQHLYAERRAAIEAELGRRGAR